MGDGTFMRRDFDPQDPFYLVGRAKMYSKDSVTRLKWALS